MNEFDSLKLEKEQIELLDSHSIKNINDLAYVYFLYNNDLLVYVGKTLHLTNRIATHTKTKLFTHYRYLECTRNLFTALEKYYIEKFNPIYNITDNKNTYLENGEILIKGNYIHARNVFESKLVTYKIVEDRYVFTLDNNPVGTVVGDLIYIDKKVFEYKRNIRIKPTSDTNKTLLLWLIEQQKAHSYKPYWVFIQFIKRAKNIDKRDIYMVAEALHYKPGWSKIKCQELGL